MIGPFDHPVLRGLMGDDDAAAIWSPARHCAHMLRFEAAYTRALGRVGTLSRQEADALAARIEAFQPDMDGLRAGTAQDGVAVPSLVAQLKETLGGPAGAIHTGTTSQDVVDTALALTLKEFNDLLESRLDAAMSAIAALSDRFGARGLMGRTRMQAALPIRVEDRLITWSEPLHAHAKRLDVLRPIVERLQLGGPVGDRAALAPHADEIAALMASDLGLGNPARAWHATRDGIVDYGGLLSLITGSLGKVGQDICLMAQQGIDEVALSGGGGSSAMPHKQNPVLAELLVTLARFNATQIGGLHHALVHEQERSGVAWTLEWMILPQMAQATARSLAAVVALSGQITSMGND